MAGNMMVEAKHVTLESLSRKMEFVVDASSLILAAVLIIVGVMILGATVQDLLHLSSGTLHDTRAVVLNVLNILVIMELIRMFLKMEVKQYFQVTILIDAGLVFVVREILVTLYDNAQDHLAGQLMVFMVFCAARLALGWAGRRKPDAEAPKAVR